MNTIEMLWENFKIKNNLNDKQIDLFKKFYDLLLKSNIEINLTKITDLKACLNWHFEDSLMINNFLDFSKITGLVDIGSGGGFPGIPLKIIFPDIKIILIEVTRKKINFLNNVIKSLELKDIEVYPLDWRTFLRKTEYKIELFCARASLKPLELMRMFKPGCKYHDAKLVYWASQNWEATKLEAPFIKEEYYYEIKHKNRKLVLFSN